MSLRGQLAKLEHKARRWPRLFLATTLVLSIGCFGPWLVTHFGHLWHREHYQFFPMMLIAVAGLAFASWKNAMQQGQSFETLRLSTPLFVFAVMTFTAALWLNSPWLAFLTAIVVLWAVLRNVPFGAGSIAPLLVLLPLPFTMDGELVHGLQRVSSRGASALLDLARITHLMSGNVLEVADRSFFVEEACSGVGSVFLLLASAAIYASWRQLRLVVAIPLLVSALFWAVAGNTFRIFSVAWAHVNLQLDLSSGILHDVLGSVTYLLSLLMLIMTEQTLLFVFEPVPLAVRQDAALSAKRRLMVTIGNIWNRKTLMDPQIRTQRYITRGISGFRVTRGLFLLALTILFSFGCAGNFWRFWPELKASAQSIYPALREQATPPLEFAESIPDFVIAPLRSLKPAILGHITGLSFARAGHSTAFEADGDESPTNAGHSAARITGKSQTLRAELTSAESSVLQQIQWDLHFSETPARLTIEGPFRLADSVLEDAGNDTTSETGDWNQMEEATAPVDEIAGQLPVISERILRNSLPQFRHELTARFTQRAEPLPISQSGSMSAIQQQISDRRRSVASPQDEWYWHVTLSFESPQLMQPSVRQSRVADFGEILQALLEHWRDAK